MVTDSSDVFVDRGCRLMALKALACAAGLLIAVPALAIADSAQFNIAAQGMPGALKEFAAQAHMQLLYQFSAVAGLKSNALNGNVDKHEALQKLLQNSGLQVVFTSADSAAIRPVTQQASATAEVPSEARTNPNEQEGKKNSSDDFRVAQESKAISGKKSAVENSAASSSEAKSVQLQEIVVTGTHIRGVDTIGSSLLTISRSDIDYSGVTSTEELMERLPQNVAQLTPRSLWGSNPGLAASGNYQAASSISLHGLGPESTLVLVDGKRRAGAVGGQVVDVSSIPLSMIDHVDVLTGGYSAEYGSDAVAGVVNIVLRKDYDGAETKVTYGAADHGGTTVQASQLLGRRFDSGGFFLGYQFNESQALRLSETSIQVAPSQSGYFQPVADQWDVTPKTKQHSVMFSGHLDVSNLVQLYVDGLGSSSLNKVSNKLLIIGSPFTTWANTNSNQYSVVAGAKVLLSSDWQLDTTGEYGATENHEEFSSGSGSASPTAALADFSIVANGTLLSLGTSNISAAIGADYRRETYSGGTAFEPVGFSPSNSARSISSAFIELRIPTLTDNLGRRVLEFSVAGRYDHYSDFGSTFNPQLAVSYKPIEAIAFSASYAKAFQAPSLFQLHEPFASSFYTMPNPSVPSGTSPALTLSGGNPDLGPQKADTWNLGINFTPSDQCWPAVSASYFNIKYKHRLGLFQPSKGFFSWLSDPSAGDVTIRNPSPTLVDSIVQQSEAIYNYTGQPFDPASQSASTAFPGLVVLDGRTLNISEDAVEGLDINAESKYSTGIGTMRLGANGTYYLSYKRRVTSSSPEIDEISGPGLPTKFRLRAHAGIESSSVSGNVFVNFINGYANNATDPALTVASWTTVDASVQYRTGTGSQSPLGSGISVLLSVQNLLNRSVPFVGGSQYGLAYDPVNASPTGRFTSLSVSKSW